MVTKKEMLEKAKKWDRDMTAIFQQLDLNEKELRDFPGWFGAVQLSLREVIYQLRGTIIELEKPEKKPKGLLKHL